MPFAPPETLPDAEFDIILTRVALWITKLPKELPHRTEANTAFKEFLAPFHPDPDYLEKTGCECAAIGEQLERVFGYQTRSSGLLTIQEQGPGLVAVHAVLLEYYHKHPSNMVHKKWIVDIANAVERIFMLHEVPVCHVFETHGHRTHHTDYAEGSIKTQ